MATWFIATIGMLALLSGIGHLSQWPRSSLARTKASIRLLVAVWALILLSAP